MRGNCKSCLHWKRVQMGNETVIGESVDVCTFNPPTPALIPQQGRMQGVMQLGVVGLRAPTKPDEECGFYEPRLTMTKEGEYSDRR
jgi:hypothetical protein